MGKSPQMLCPGIQGLVLGPRCLPQDNLSLFHFIHSPMSRVVFAWTFAWTFAPPMRHAFHSFTLTPVPSIKSIHIPTLPSASYLYSTPLTLLQDLLETPEPETTSRWQVFHKWRVAHLI